MPKLTTQPPLVDIAEVLPQLAEMVCWTVRLHPRHIEDSSALVDKIGGRFLWPENEPWPVSERFGEPFVGVLQLTKETVPELGFPQGKDLFQLLWCPKTDENAHGDEDYSYYRPEYRIYWRALKEITKPFIDIPNPVQPWDWLIPEVCGINPEQVLEYPKELTEELYEEISQSEVLQELADEYDDQEFAGDPLLLYLTTLSVASGSKVGGYVNWSQDPAWPVCDCGCEMEHFFTLSETEFDGASFFRWLPVEESHVWDTDYEVRKLSQSPTGLDRGRDRFFFICRQCDDWPVKDSFEL